MNATLCSETRADFEICHICEITDLSVMTEDRYATTPLESVAPKQQPVDEEALHTSFEEALSDRLIALNDHWNLRSDCQLTSIQQQTPLYATDLLVAQTHRDTDTEPLDLRSNETASQWARRIMIGCLMLMLLMTGFDLMGLLVLHIR